ncbi:MAG: GMC family oxidoreductase N-terminal domain-containing protein [Cytophagales bacterium]|nr:GMC family oxidoreductase N-terminal domain-containing protein [Cytophagales bacterium]
MNPFVRPQQAANEKTKDRHNAYDYLIVGAGSGGCAVARRLVESTDARILVLEAGGSDDGIDSISNPLRWLENIGAAHDYLYQYQPTPHVNNRVILVPRGKVLGGSGSINALVWARGHQDDYNGWAAAGNPGWDYQSVLPLFKRTEDWEGGETPFHGAGGPIRVERPKKLHWVDASVIEAAVSYGMPYHEDTNGPQPEGVGPMSMTIGHGLRSSPFRGYLLPVLNRNNLTLVTGAKVLKLNVQGSRCTGVDYLHDGQIITATASQEVILCGGAIETPRVLMLSGIGEAGELQRLGIKTKMNLPGVGKNLQDHPLVSVPFETKEPLGQLTYNLGGSNLYWKSSDSVRKPDLMLVPIQVGIASNEIREKFPIPTNAFSVFVTLVDVRSRGYLSMESADHDGPLVIQPNLIGEPEDVEALASAVELCLDLASQPALRNIIKRWVAPPTRMSRRGIIAFIREACGTYFHPVGTCSMGTGPDAVVNHRLQVYGVEGLRIADASIMPQIPTANTNAPTLMIGEFASELILGKR